MAITKRFSRSSLILPLDSPCPAAVATNTLYVTAHSPTATRRFVNCNRMVLPSLFELSPSCSRDFDRSSAIVSVASARSVRHRQLTECSCKSRVITTIELDRHTAQKPVAEKHQHGERVDSNHEAGQTIGAQLHETHCCHPKGGQDARLRGGVAYAVLGRQIRVISCPSPQKGRRTAHR